MEGSKQVLVADCKYKRMGKIEDDYQGSRLINSDFYQILAYMIGYNQDKGMLIYPKSEVEEEIESSVYLDQKQARIFVKPIDLDEIEEEKLKTFVKEVETIVRS